MKHALIYRYHWVRYWLRAAWRGECEPCNRRKRFAAELVRALPAIARRLPGWALDQLLGAPRLQEVMSTRHLKVVTLPDALYRVTVQVRTQVAKRPKARLPLRKAEPIRLASVYFGSDPVPVPMYQGHPRGPVDWIYEAPDCFAVEGLLNAVSDAEIATAAAHKIQQDVLGVREQRAGDRAWKSHEPHPFSHAVRDIMGGGRGRAPVTLPKPKGK